LWIEELRRAKQLPASYGVAVTEYVAPLAERIRTLHEQLDRPVVIGINGAQGSGKTTLALFLTEWLQRESALTAASLSLDDLYLGKQAREELAESKHPLLRTRGVPGTHDVALGKELLQALTEQSEEHVVRLPVFDKATDDRLQPTEWPGIGAPVDVVLFEGWCVGARPQRDADLRDPVNALEAQDDTDGRWRSFVNKNLKSDYAELFAQLDALLMLRIPSFDKVFEWRELQEQKLPGESGMNTAELRDFVMHFERLTRHMLARMPDYANTIIDLDDSHRMVDMLNRNWPGAPDSS
jgi:D-glycerate 3-kinase